MRIISVKALPVDDSAPKPAPRPRRWRLIGLSLAIAISGSVWLAIFWGIGYFF